MELSDGGYGVDIGGGGVGGLVGGVVVDSDDASATPMGSRGAIGEREPEVFALLRRFGYLLPTRWVGKARAGGACEPAFTFP
jgi:hypothetical protein